MNDINFIDPIPPKKQAAFELWFRISCSVALIILITAVALQVRQWFKTSSMHNKYIASEQVKKELSELAQQTTKLKEQYGALEQKLHKIQQKTHYPKSPSEHLARIAPLFNDDTNKLISCSIKKESIELTAHAPSTKEVRAYQEQLLASGLYKNVEITALHPADTAASGSLVCTIKGTVVQHG